MQHDSRSQFVTGPHSNYTCYEYNTIQYNAIAEFVERNLPNLRYRAGK